MKTIRIKINPLLRRRPKPRRNSAAHQQRTSKRRKRRVTRARRNPSRSHRYCVTALVRTGPKRFKTYYWNGRNFERDKAGAQTYPHIAAMRTAKQLLHQVTGRVYALRVERVTTLGRNPRGGLRQKDVAAELRGYNVVLKKYENEYIVNFKGGREATAYYTDDLEDALLTGRAMAKRA